MKIAPSEHPEQINVKGRRDVTPLHAATTSGHADILALLLKHGSDVEARDVFGQTPLHRASVGGKLEAGRCLLDHGADINPRAHRNLTPLCAAVLNGHIEFARMLLGCGAAMDVRPDMETGQTLLTTAIALRKVQSVQLLLEYGEDVNERDGLGRSPSQWV
jgi:ankyrin repeat protein